VAIDGAAGAGKSTLARELARRLGLAYVNTGLMYRVVAARALREGASPSDGPGLAGIGARTTFSLATPPDSPVPELAIDGEPPGPDLASSEVEAIVSEVARHPEVRSVLRRVQRTLGAEGSVMEGRDIGTVVFPDADVKLFLSAPPDVRAQRRERERGGDVGAGEAVARRDALDAKTNPLEPAPDAFVLDTTELGPGEVLVAAVQLVDSALRGEIPAVTATQPPVVAVIGRQNVGKSTLVNRLVGRREAIAHETPGVTRDRIEVPVQWGGRSFVLVDTGGLAERPVGVEQSVGRQALRAAEQADLTLLVVDAQTGITSEDESLARRLRRSARPVLVVANKVDSEAQEPLAAEFHALGLGEPLPVSALHGRGSGELLDRILDLIPEGPESQLEDEARFAIVGRPNVGKSSLFNRLVSEERVVVHPEPGTTRDAVDSVVELEGHRVRFVDTAGFRRPGKTQGVEYYGLVRSLRAIDAAHVALLVIDAGEGLTGEDKRVAARVAEAGRGMVAVINKWDLVPSGERADRFVELKRQLTLFPGTPVLRTSALTGSGVARVAPSLLSVHAAWSRRVGTAEVNKVLEAATSAHPPPGRTGRIRYGTQVSAGPPTFALFGSTAPAATYRRYLERSLREAFGLGGVPVRLLFRKGKSRRGPPRRGR
jgi:GTP-binding protein